MFVPSYEPYLTQVLELLQEQHPRPSPWIVWVKVNVSLRFNHLSNFYWSFAMSCDGIACIVPRKRRVNFSNWMRNRHSFMDTRALEVRTNTTMSALRALRFLLLLANEEVAMVISLVFYLVLQCASRQPCLSKLARYHNVRYPGACKM